MKTLKLFLFFFLIPSFVFSQVDWNTAGNNINGGEFLGSSSGNFPLSIKTVPAQPINFWTNNVQRMTILSSGVVGIGTSTPNPAYYLDVNGEINIFDPTGGQNTGYRINGDAVLQQKNLGNLFVGSGAGWIQKCM
jgi:hypothetical protein